MALLEWWNTPGIDNLSLIQKLRSRRSRTTVPTAEVLLKREVAEGCIWQHQTQEAAG